jgi:putative holliday junction resolvase
LNALSLDVGRRRIGIAATDPTGALALPLEVLHRTSLRADLDRLFALLDERDVHVLVLGIPIREDGSEGPMGREARFIAGKLVARRPALRIETCDEAYSTAEAEERLRERGLDARQQRALIDAIAAQVILEGWMATQAKGM